MLAFLSCIWASLVDGTEHPQTHRHTDTQTHTATPQKATVCSSFLLPIASLHTFLSLAGCVVAGARAYVGAYVPHLCVKECNMRRMRIPASGSFQLKGVQ